jgi:hypothetical protein
MTSLDFITELFCRVDNKLGLIPKHSQATLYPSEVVTLALLYALKEWANGLFGAGWCATTGLAFPTYRLERVCFACLTVIGIWLTSLWLTHPC